MKRIKNFNDIKLGYLYRFSFDIKRMTDTKLDTILRTVEYDRFNKNESIKSLIVHFTEGSDSLREKFNNNEYVSWISRMNMRDEDYLIQEIGNKESHPEYYL